MTSMTPAPQNTGHRFAPITADNAAGQLWISSILCLIYCSLVLIVRLHIKWNLYGADDVMVTLATFLQLGEVVPLFIAMRNGLGVSEHLLDSSQITTVGKATFTAQLFLILSLATSKVSVAALMLRLFPRDINLTRKPWIACHATLVLIVFWAVGSIIATAMGCGPSDFIRVGAPGQCHDRLDRWRIIAAIDIFTELLLVLLPVAFLWPIQLHRYLKLQVVIAFSFRIPIIAFAAMHLHYVSKYTSSTNVSKAIIPALVCQQYELFWSLLSATIPTLKAFMRSFNSGFGMEIDADVRSGYRSKPYKNQIYPLQSIQQSVATTGIKGPDASEATHQESIKKQSVKESRIRSARMVRSANTDNVRDPSDQDTTISLAGPHEAHGSSFTSDGSEEMIIKRQGEWHTSVSYEEQVT